MPPQITHVIFDFDGVLIDSEQVYSNGNSKLLSKFGKKFTLEMKISMMGQKKSQAIKLLLQKAEIDHLITPDEYMVDYDKFIQENMTECEELPGASKLINYFYDQKLPLAICTGSDTVEFDVKTSKLYKHWLEKIPLHVLCGDDPEVTEGKPSPIPYQVTMKRMDKQPVKPENVLVFEDSINGAKAGIAAGCRTVMIPQYKFLDEGGLRELDLIRPHLAELLNSLEEFDPTRYGLPPFNNVN